jgi:hypothetical protein
MTCLVGFEILMQKNTHESIASFENLFKTHE